MSHPRSNFPMVFPHFSVAYRLIWRWSTLTLAHKAPAILACLQALKMQSFYFLFPYSGKLFPHILYMACFFIHHCCAPLLRNLPFNPYHYLLTLVILHMHVYFPESIQFIFYGLSSPIKCQFCEGGGLVSIHWCFPRTQNKTRQNIVHKWMNK